MIWARACTLAALMLTLLILPLQAVGAPSPRAADGEDAAGAHATAHRHHAGIFVGATTNLSSDHTDPTLGIDYEYRLPAPALHNMVGLAAFGEFTFAAHDEWIIGAGVVLHPGDGLKLFAGGGLLFIEEQNGGKLHGMAAGTSEKSDNSHLLWRVGAGWELPAGSFSLTPSLFYDRVEGHGNLVYGVTLGTSLPRRSSGASPH